MHLYLAGPLFTEAERRFNAALAAALEAAGYRVYLPQRDSPPAERNPALCFAANLAALDTAAAVVAVLDGPQVDDGTAWELGRASARGTPVFGLRTDSRPAGEDGRGANLMILQALAGFACTTAELVAVLRARLAAPSAAPRPSGAHAV